MCVYIYIKYTSSFLDFQYRPTWGSLETLLAVSVEGPHLPLSQGGIFLCSPWCLVEFFNHI